MKNTSGRELALVVAGYSVLTAILTFPAVFQLSTHFMHASADGMQCVWNLWWIKKALIDGSNPFYTHSLYYPQGITLLFHALHPWDGLLSVPLQLIFGMKVAYNGVVLLSFVMAGVGMYLLVRLLTAHRPAAFVAGIVFTFSPYHFAHAIGHLHLVSMEWIPFYVLYLVKLYRQPALRHALLAIFFLILCSLCAWYYLMFCLLLTGIVAAYLLLFDRQRVLASGFLGRLALTLLGFFLCMLPLFGAMVRERYRHAFETGHDAQTYLADLASFFVPSQFSTWGRLWFGDMASRWAGNPAESSNYLGYLALGLAVYAALRVRAARLWAAAGVVFAVLALGPYLQINGWDTQLPLPYLVLDRYVPLLSFAGVPTRFDAMVKLSLAILVGYAVSELGRRRFGGTERSPATEPLEVMSQASRPAAPTSPRERRLAAVIGLLICIEYLALPYHTTPAPVPQLYRTLAADPETYGVLEIPTSGLDVDGYRMYYATVHGKPLVAGDISRRPLAAVQSLDVNPLTATLIHRHPPPPANQIAAAVDGLARDNIRYIVAHDDRFRALLEDVCRLPKVYDDGGITAYRIPSPDRR